MTFSSSEAGFTVSIKQVFQTIVYPFQYVFSKIWDFFADIFRSITKIRQYRDKLEETQARLQKMSRSYREIEELKNQIRVLKKALGLYDELKQDYDQNPISARVVSHDPHNGYLTLIINKGSKQGIKKNMVVVGYFKGKAGIIGRVIETTPFTAKVMPIHDKASNIGAMISRTRVTGIIEGQGRGKLLELTFIPVTENVQKGDLIVTSPESDLFPKGLLLGYVEEVENPQGAFHKRIKVKPYIQYNKIEIIFILKKVPSKYVQKLEQDK
jgi:rod shape-determining protein MreC